MHHVTKTLSGLSHGSVAVLATLVIVALGCGLSWAMGLRDRLLLIATAPAVAVGALTVTGEVVGVLRLGASPFGLLVIDVVAAVVFFVGLRLLRRNVSGEAPSRYDVPWQVWVACAIGALIAAAIWLPGFGHSSTPPQNNDDIWHGYLITRLDALHRITTTTVAPSFVDRATPIVYYPYGLHLVSAVVRAVTHIGAADAMNGAWAVYAGMLLPFGAATLAWRVYPGRTTTAAAAALVSPVLAAYPYLPTSAWAYSVSVAFIPGFVSLLLARLAGGGTVVPAGVLVAVALGMVLAHPAGAAAGSIVAALVTVEWLVRSGGADAVRGLRRLVVPTIATAVVVLPWALSAGGTALTSTPAHAFASTIVRALWRLVSLNVPGTVAQTLGAVLLVVGAVIAIVSRRGYSLVAACAVFAVLAAGLAAGRPGFVSLTKVWWSDWWRLFAIAVLLAPVLIGRAADAVVAAFRSQAVQPSRWRRWPAVGGAVALALFALGNAGRYVVRDQSLVASYWQSEMRVTSDDLALFHEMRARLPRGSGVLEDWENGSAWMYAVAGIRPAVPYGSSVTPEWSHVVASADAGRLDPPSCRTINDDNVRYVFVKDGNTIGDPRFAPAVEANHSDFSLLLRDGSAALFSITAC